MKTVPRSGRKASTVIPTALKMISATRIPAFPLTMPSRLVCCLAAAWLAVATPAVGRADEAAAESSTEAGLKYPLAVAVAGDVQYVVDLDLPGVWKFQGGKPEVFVKGTNLLRTPLNRPRSIAMHPEGGVLVGDSATREVYHVSQAGADPKPLSNGMIGIPMAIAVAPDGQMIYVGDAEKRSVVRLPIGGGEPEMVAPVNARGLAFDGEDTLWAVTPDDAAVQRIDVAAKTHEPVITGRPYRYPNGLAWGGDFGLVTDGYGKSIWKFTADGKTEPWVEGAPLTGPVGITMDADAVWVADPKAVQLLQFNKQSKSVVPSS